jgi:uncharacterized membrane protein YdjX (TVP38/TMEM64 family)
MSGVTMRQPGATGPVLFGALVVAIVGLALVFGGHALSLASLHRHAADLAATVALHPIVSSVTFFIVYVAATAISLPGAAILTLAAGALFGVVEGSVLVSFASSIGASFAFLTARFLLRDFALARFPSLFARIDQGIARDGAGYLISLRLVPAVPFVAINLLAGLTKLSLRRFYVASQVGMLPATIIYVNAGAGLATLGNHGAILTPRLILGLLLLAALPVLAPRLRGTFTARRAYAGFARPKRFDRNLVVIGAGAAGLVAAYVANTLRAKVTLIEAAEMGGDCLNTGCVPSKALLHAARQGMDFATARAAVKAAVDGVSPHDSVARYQGLGVDVRRGHATIDTPWSVTINGATITTRAIVRAAATGSG